MHGGKALKFSTNDDNKRRKLGRPQDLPKSEAFLETMAIFDENDEEQMTVSQLVEKMQEIMHVRGDSSEVYSTVYMKKRIVEHFGGDFLITSASGKADIVTHKTNVSEILHEVFEKREARSEEAQKFTIIRAAAKLFQSEIKEMKSVKILTLLAKIFHF